MQGHSAYTQICPFFAMPVSCGMFAGPAAHTILYGCWTGSKNALLFVFVMLLMLMLLLVPLCVSSSKAAHNSLAGLALHTQYIHARAPFVPRNQHQTTRLVSTLILPTPRAQHISRMLRLARVATTQGRRGFSSAAAQPSVGFIGLGNMGGHMAHNLVKAGRKVVVFGEFI